MAAADEICRLERQRDAAWEELAHVQERVRVAESVLCTLLISRVVKLDVDRRTGSPALSNFQAAESQVTLNDLQGDLVHKIVKAVLSR